MCVAVIGAAIIVESGGCVNNGEWRWPSEKRVHPFWYDVKFCAILKVDVSADGLGRFSPGNEILLCCDSDHLLSS